MSAAPTSNVSNAAAESDAGTSTRENTSTNVAPDACVTSESPAPDIDSETMIRRLHAGEVDAMDLPLAMRHTCVAYLTEQGFASIDIASLMRMNERTVRRDRAAIRRDEALVPDKHLGDELLGEYQRLVHSGIQRLTRRANDKNEQAYVRLWAEEAITRMYQRFIDTARKMNYIRDGYDRVKQQIAIDPAEQKRDLASYEAMLDLSEAKNPLPRLRAQQDVLQLLKKLGAPVGKPKQEKPAPDNKPDEKTKSNGQEPEGTPALGRVNEPQRATPNGTAERGHQPTDRSASVTSRQSENNHATAGSAVAPNVKGEQGVKGEQVAGNHADRNIETNAERNSTKGAKGGTSGTGATGERAAAHESPTGNGCSATPGMPCNSHARPCESPATCNVNQHGRAGPSAV